MSEALGAVVVVLARVDEESTAYNLGRYFGYALVIALVFFGVRALLRRSSSPSTRPEGTPPGWYANPGGEGERWWDGERWHERYRSAPGAPDDPGPPPPAPPAAG